MRKKGLHIAFVMMPAFATNDKADKGLGVSDRWNPLKAASGISPSAAFPENNSNVNLCGNYKAKLVSALASHLPAYV